MNPKMFAPAIPINRFDQSGNPFPCSDDPRIASPTPIDVHQAIKKMMHFITFGLRVFNSFPNQCYYHCQHYKLCCYHQNNKDDQAYFIVDIHSGFFSSYRMIEAGKIGINARSYSSWNILNSGHVSQLANALALFDGQKKRISR
jgi:hypothetical protein